MITDQQLTDFCAAVDAKRTAYFKARGFTVANNYEVPAVFERGVKNARIVTGPAGNRSVFCFVRLEDGAILKAAGWKAPAKGVRGNIANGAADVTEYGAAYLR